jgi:hypothetical protein
MQVNNANAQATMGGRHADTKPGAVIDRSVTSGANGAVSFSKSLSLPNGKTMTMERSVARDENGFSMHMQKLLPSGRDVVIDVTKTNDVAETGDEVPQLPPSDAPSEAATEQQAGADPAPAS